jgi:hypothetical protein
MNSAIHKIKDEDVATHLAVMQLQIETLTKTVDGLTQEVKNLNALANQGKGSIKMLFVLGALWTGLIATLSFMASYIYWK